MNRCKYKKKLYKMANRKYPDAVIMVKSPKVESVDFILNKVCELYEVDVKDVMATNRTRAVPFPEIRQVAMTLFMDKLDMTSGKAASVFFKDHATALHARKKIRGFREIDKKFREFTDPLFS